MNSFSDEDVKNYANFLNKLSPNELIILASIVGISLSQGLTAYQGNSLGNFIEAVGQIMLSYASQISLQNNIHKR